MKKQHLLFLSLFLSFCAHGAIIRIQNNTSNLIDVGIKYGKKGQPGEKRKSEIIKPGQSTFFNSWIEEINTIYWKEGKNKWKVGVAIPAFTIGRKYTIYENGRYDGTQLGENLKAKEFRKKHSQPEEKSTITSKKIKKTHKTYEEHRALKNSKKIALGDNSPEWQAVLQEELERRSQKTPPSNNDTSNENSEKKRRRPETVQEEEEAESTATEASRGK